MRRRGKPETDLSRSIQDALLATGFMCERVQSGEVKVRGGWMQLASNGTPDLWTNVGWLEVKLPGKKPTETQLDWHARALRAGVRVAVVHDPSEALRQALAWRRENG